jgi:hypothetical protein
MVHTSPPSRRHLAAGGAPRRSPAVPLTAVGPYKIRPTDLLNWTVQFPQLRAGAFGSCPFQVATHFSEYAREPTTSSTSSMKAGNSGNNGSNFDKSNMLKPTIDTLTEEGRKAFEAYRANLEEFFLSCCEVTQHGTVLKDTTPIVFNKPHVIPEV